MCGIAGCIALDGGSPDTAGVRAMTEALVHRGPDGDGFFADGPVALGFRRLAILDLTPAGNQPMTDASGRFTIVFNGEIYNYIEIRAGLEAEGARFRSHGDTEVLLEGFARKGEAILEDLNGMFAFAIWDARERTLFAARDRFGEKPFYYQHRPGQELRFASEIKALIPPGAGVGRPRRDVLFRFLAYGHAGTGGVTFFEGIDQIPPAHSLTVKDGRLVLKKYWSLPEHVRPQAGDDAVACVAALIESSVALRLRSDVPVGTTLSGGIDSSTVVGWIARLLREGHAGGAPTRQASFSACFPGRAEDESAWIDAVVREMGIESHRVVPTGEEFVLDLPQVVESQDEPIGGPSIYAQWKVMQLAKHAGVVVLLDGQGADEVFAGYHFLFQDLWWSLLRAGHLRRLRREMKDYDAVHGTGRAQAILGAAVRARAARLLREYRRPRLPWLDAGFVGTGTDPMPARPHDLRGALLESQRTRMLPHLLRHADRNSMAASREVRLPFLDHRLVEAVDALPDRMKLRGAMTKWVLREAIRGVVPEAVRTRSDKLGFAVPTLAWLRGPCAVPMRDTLLSRRARERGIFELGWIAPALDRFQAGDDAPAQALWNCWAAELWLRAFVDAPGGRG